MEPNAVWARSTGPSRKHWRLTHLRDRFELETSSGTSTFAGADLSHLSIGRSWFRPVLNVAVPGARPMRLRGLASATAGEITQALAQARLFAQVGNSLERVVGWAAEVHRVVSAHQRKGRWISEEVIAQLESHRPIPVKTARDVYQTVGRLLSLEEKEAFSLCSDGKHLRRWIEEVNESTVERELRLRRAFFDTIESSPLTDEQARAVVCFDNRVHVIAAAGSGKTSVMVARAAYAVARKFVKPERILVLAFNKDAADELQRRIDARFAAAGIDSTGVRAATFHSFGLSVIGEATGRKPTVAPWVADNNDVREIGRIVDTLRDSDLQFRYAWDLFRLLYARTAEDAAQAEPDAYDPAKRLTGLRTYRGEVVKSAGERLIADFLYLSGIEYEYERPFHYDTVDAQHRQYRPDFYYPDVDVWHEHWALDAKGNPPAEFTGYLDSMRWKRRLHEHYATSLIETTWGEILSPKGLERLQRELVKHGLQPDWNPDRPLPGAQPVKHEDLCRLVRTFMTHVKSNSLTEAALKEHARRSPRTRVFLDLYWKIHQRWEERLRQEECVDFDDMLVRASELIESGQYQSPYELVMVDEFQDASQARARITKALAKFPGRFLLAVGDDWQSINRFAGAELSVLTDFERWFGRGQTLRLQKTFRCRQAVVDVASTFVAKNPRQLQKEVTSVHPDAGPGVRLVRVGFKESIRPAIASVLDQLARDLKDDLISTPADRQLSVDVLGRYGFDRDLMPSRTPPGLQVNFRTIHSAKGLEADFVILPNLTRGTYGFPSQIADDPVLDIVMAKPDDFEHAEERRLFYVALTRARHGVFLVAPTGLESPFVAELIADGAVDVDGSADISGATSEQIEVCPACARGTVIAKSGRFGRFLGCSTFPKCAYSRAMP